MKLISLKSDGQDKICLEYDENYKNIIDYLMEDMEFNDKFKLEKTKFLLIETNKYERVEERIECEEYDIIKEGNLFELGCCSHSEYFTYMNEIFEIAFREWMCSQDFCDCLKFFSKTVINLYSEMYSDKSLNIHDIVKNKMMYYCRP